MDGGVVDSLSAAPAPATAYFCSKFEKTQQQQYYCVQCDIAVRKMHEVEFWEKTVSKIIGEKWFGFYTSCVGSVFPTNNGYMASSGPKKKVLRIHLHGSFDLMSDVTWCTVCRHLQYSARAPFHV